MWHVRFLRSVASAAFIQVTVFSPALHAQSGAMRDLRCRGKPGIDIRVHQDPSPRTPSLVTMVLRYDLPKETRSLGQVGMGTVDYGMTLQFIPGSCSWRTAGSKDIPFEPGVVYFDLPRDAQSWKASGARDTTIDVAMNFPDVVSLPRYLSDSTRYWGFYVDDVTNVSISFGPRGRPAPPIAFGPRDTTSGTRTRSGAHTSVDSTTTRPTARGSTTARTSTAGDKASGSLRDKSPAPSTTAGAKPLPNDSATGRAGATRAPTPAPVGTIGGLRDGSPGDPSPASRRALPSESTSIRPSDAASVGTRRLTNVRTVPGVMGITILFDAQIAGLFNKANSIEVTISSQPPTLDRKTQKWSYPDWHAFMSVDWRHLGGSAFEAVPTYKLQPGRRYYYLITLFPHDPPVREQRTGSFTAEVLNELKKPSK